MSMHHTPLSDIERAGLYAHRLAIETPSQLSDTFRLGVAWGLAHADMNTDTIRPMVIAEFLQKSGKWLVNEAILLDHDNRLLTKLREEILDELITSTQPQKITWGKYYANKIQEFINKLKG